MDSLDIHVKGMIVAETSNTSYSKPKFLQLIKHVLYLNGLYILSLLMCVLPLYYLYHRMQHKKIRQLICVKNVNVFNCSCLNHHLPRTRKNKNNDVHVYQMQFETHLQRD